jgi:anti-sigma regulatory factor (Ser/Thr protein kinase)
LEALATTAALLGVTARIREHSAPAQLPPSIEKAAYHIIQEALTNVARHCGASSADVEILFETMSRPPTTERPSSLRGMVPSLRLPIDRSHTFAVAGPWE